MIKIVTGCDAEVARWVAAQINDPGLERGFGPCSAIGVVENGRPIAGMVYHNFHPEVGTIELSAASVSKRWLTRPVLKVMFAYPFNGLGCCAVFIRTKVGNRQENGRGIARIAKAYGFEQFRIPCLYGRDGDGYLQVLTEERWRSGKFK